jgi:hypothetical protein
MRARVTTARRFGDFLLTFGVVGAVFSLQISSRTTLSRPPSDTIHFGPFIILPNISKRCVKCGDLFLPFYLSIVAQIKNESLYLAEWIEYHLLVGVELFDLVLNDNEDNATDVLQPYVSSGVVTVTTWRGPCPPPAVYTSRVQLLRDYSCWIAIIDADEFVVPLEGHSVSELLHRYEGFPGVQINWVVFGTNGKMTREFGLVMERFRVHTALDLRKNRHVKTIVNPRMTWKCINHDHHYLNGRLAVDVKMREMKVYFLDTPPVYETLRINHYYTKSVEEFRLKRLRGDAAGLPVKQMLDDLQQHIDYCKDVIENDTGVDWAIPLVKENLVKRQSQA